MTDVKHEATPLHAAAAQRELNSLMSHQGWLWGVDVRCPEGNRLIEFGFEKVRAPDGQVDCSTRYELVSGDRTILLWSWGYSVCRPDWGEAIHVSRAGSGIHGVSRQHFATPCWKYDDSKLTWQPLNPESTPNLPEVLLWPAEFEGWVQQRIGVEQREAELAVWKNARRRASSVLAGWEELAMRWPSVRQAP